MKNRLLLTVTSVLLFFVSSAQTVGPTYCGNYTISAPITLENVKDSIISGLEISNPTGDCIQLKNCSNITIKQCKLSNASGNGVDIYNSDSVIITDCRMDSIATGVYAQQSTKIQVYNIEVKNVIGPFPRGQMVQFNNVNGPSNKINYNVAENILGESYPEDIINLYVSNGTLTDPIQVIGNWIRGGGPSSSGGGILAGDNGGSNVLVKDNILVDPGQYGLAIASGTNIELRDNTVYGKQQSFTNVGLYVWNQYPSSCSNHTVSGNKVNWTNQTGQVNNSWDGTNCGTITDWNNNEWGAVINSTILPSQILLNCSTTVGFNTYENELFNQVAIFPNPTQEIINIDLATLKDVSINVYNPHNLSVYQAENINSKSHQFELPNATGIHFIEITSHGKSKTYKLILKQ